MITRELLIRAGEALPVETLAADVGRPDNLSIFSEIRVEETTLLASPGGSLPEGDG